MKYLIILVGMFFFSTSDASAQIANPTNAYGDGINLPMALVEPGVWAIYSGDINQDGTIDGADMNFIDNDANVGAFGYNLSDLTGDGGTDGSDMNYVDNNSTLSLFYARP